MNRLYTIFLAVTAFTLISCQDEFDKVAPSGSQLDPGQVEGGSHLSPDAAEARLRGMYNQLNARNGIFNSQDDFGYPSFACRLEHAGDNVVSTTQGYNQFSGELRLADFQDNQSSGSIWAWKATYENIILANELIDANKNLTTSFGKVLAGQAYAMRAWDYFLLAQLFGKNYPGNEDTPCVPVKTDEDFRETLYSNPRKTVREIYEFILKDLQTAAEKLKGYAPEPKNHISEAVVYGMRSRVYMVMNRWEEAAADAQKAIELSSAKPFTIEDCSIPNFDKLEDADNAMWGIIITPKDPVTMSGIANFTSMFTSLCFGSGGYTNEVGTYKLLNTRVWNRIPKSDIRKQWWAEPYKVVVVNEKTQKKDTITLVKSELLHNAYGKSNVLKKGNDEKYLSRELFPYAVVKFAPTKKDLANKDNSDDFFLMRVEEMYYNLAEAKAMAGHLEEGAKILNDFVKTYRDPEYSKTFKNAAELQDEVYFQKRIEFFGEGISWFDMKRMNKGIDRVDVEKNDNGGYPELTRFNVPAGDPIFTWQIPLSEEQANKAIKGHNNPAYTAPKDQI